MMTREDIRELAAFQADSDGCALSFYFQPRTPQNKSHKEESILAKDLVRQAMREAEKEGKNSCARADLDRILEIAGNLHGNQAKAKAVFASSTKKLWREFDLPPYLPATQLFVNRRFHLKPLAALLVAQPMLCATLGVRQRRLGHLPADVASVTNDEIREHADRILRESIDRRREKLVQEALSQAKGNARGVTGLRRVLRSLELGEVQTLLLGENYTARA